MGDTLQGETPKSAAPSRCPACFTTYVEHTMFSDRIFILEGSEGWILLECQGERDNVLAYLGKERPSPDPWPEFGNGDFDEE